MTSWFISSMHGFCGYGRAQESQRMGYSSIHRPRSLELFHSLHLLCVFSVFSSGHWDKKWYAGIQETNLFKLQQLFNWATSKYKKLLEGTLKLRRHQALKLWNCEEECCKWHIFLHLCRLQIDRGCRKQVESPHLWPKKHANLVASDVIPS